MNIDLISGVNSPPRPPQPEALGTTPQQMATASKNVTATKSLDGAENQHQNAPDTREVKLAVKKIAEFVSARQSELSFSIDDVSGSQIVKIMDTQTKQVIRQFPSEEAVAIARALDKLQGLLIKDKA